jgi:hypothetical protein
MLDNVGAIRSVVTALGEDLKTMNMRQSNRAKAEVIRQRFLKKRDEVEMMFVGVRDANE